MRIELGPSRQLAGALVLIGALGAIGLFYSNLPLPLAVALAPVPLAWGALLARRCLRAPALHVAFGGDGRVHVDGTAVADVSLAWQGPLTRMGWRGRARHVRLVVWPDVLPAALRRELRLWRLAHRADTSTRPVAP